LDACSIANADLLEAFWHLACYRPRPGDPPRRVNYAALDVEELGSVYESLLEFHPHLSAVGNVPTFALLLQGAERRSTGSHYTPPELVAPLIQHALETVLDERLRAVSTRQQKERAILAMKVCDMACGSGHFLLAAARRLGKELARVRTGEDEPAPERVREAIRDVVAHCIYGVDRNPLAVELCRVALWLESHTEGKPLTFLDHRIRCGDSLVGLCDLAVLEQGIPDEAFQPFASDDKQKAREAKRQNALERRQGLFHATYADALRKIAAELALLDDTPEDTIEQIHAKAEACNRIQRSADYVRLNFACHLWTAAFFQPFPTPSGNPLTTDTLRSALANGRIGDARLAGLVDQLAFDGRFFHWPLAFPEVFAGGGFDVILGNPPFLGGLRISGAYGEKYRHWLEVAYAPYGGTADLCAVFFRRAFLLIRPGGRLGLIATNTIAQGDTRESGLKVLAEQGGQIVFAKRFVKWPGQANVEVNLVALRRSSPPGPLTAGEGNTRNRVPDGEGEARHGCVLDDQTVDFISSRFDTEPEAEPKRLPQNEGKAFIGDLVRGIGFVLEPEEAEALLAKDPRNADCLLPYLNGEDLNSHPKQKPSRYVICFHDWDLARAKQYPDLLHIVEQRVKPERERLRNRDDRRDRENWWRFARYRGDMRSAVAPLRRVLVRSRVSELHGLVFVPNGHSYGDATVVFAFDDDYHFALLQSSVHEAWLRKQASSLRTDIRYTPTDCFDTFPFPPQEYERIANAKWPVEAMPEAFQRAARVGGQYHEHRRQVMLARNLGLTKLYNLFHAAACQDADIVRLRQLHAEMDHAILACYGWTDLDPGHGFHENERGQARYTMSPAARREILRRLLDLNLKMADGERAGGHYR